MSEIGIEKDWHRPSSNISTAASGFERRELVCRVLKDRGYTCGFEYPGFVSIVIGDRIEFAAGTAGLCWGMDVNIDGGHVDAFERQDLTDESDLLKVADWICETINHTLDRIHGLRAA